MPDATPAPPAGTTLERALPGILLIAVASLAPLLGVLAQDSSGAALVVLVLVVAAAEVALAVLERLRTARIRAAVEAGVRAERRC